jgi:hypothetical protein
VPDVSLTAVPLALFCQRFPLSLHSCRQPISLSRLFGLDAFEPSDEEVSEITGSAIDVDDVDENGDLDGFIVADNEDSDGDAGPVTKPVKQANRRVIQDPDDEQSEAEEVSEEKASMSAKKAGKLKVKELPGWMAKQEPSTKMRWALDEVGRLFAE